MDCKAFDVLAEDDLRSVEVANPDDIEEQGPAGHALVIVFEPLLLTGDGKRLAGEASEADVKIGDIFLVDFGNITIDLGRGVEVGLVGLLGVRVPFAGEHRLDLVAERSVESHADAADSCEQVDGLIDPIICHAPASNFPMPG